MSNKSLDFQLDLEFEIIESLVWCSSFWFYIPSKYTLDLLQKLPGRFECQNLYISKRGNLCCDIRGGNRCPVMKEIYSENPPAYPVTQFKV